MSSQKGLSLIGQREEINGHLLYLESTQNDVANQTVVLLHHGLGSTAAWKYTTPVLMNAGWQVVNFDRWGYGCSESRPILSVPFFQEDLDDLLSIITEKCSGKVCLIGHSDGATIGAYFAARHPELVNGLIGVAGHIYVEGQIEAGILSVRDQFNQDERFRQGLQRVHGDRYQQVFTNWLNGWLNPEILGWDMRPDLHAINCAALIIQGDEDEHALPQHARDMADAIPGADLILVCGGKHMFPQDNPAEFNHLILHFLEKICSKKF